MKAHFPKLPGALAAIAALAMSAASAPIQPSPLTGATQSSVTKEALPPKTRLEKKKKAAIGGGGKPQKWQFDKSGNALDGLGNYRSAKRLRRQILMRMSGFPDTGRQWIRLRRAIRQAAPILLTIHTRDLLRFEKARQRRAA